jgi:hypothetical protein
MRAPKAGESIHADVEKPDAILEWRGALTRVTPRASPLRKGPRTDRRGA